MFWKNVSDRAALATGNFNKIFGQLEIPPLPQVAVRVLRMAQDQDLDVTQLSELIASDTGLATKVLRLVNSSSVGLRHRVKDIRHGVVLLGVKRIQSLALSLTAASAIPKQAEGFNQLEFWQTSLQRAMFAERLASRHAPGTEGEAFTAGLLQNMALPILLNRWGAQYLPIVQQARETKTPLIEVEERELTWNHAQAGAWMARNWGFLDVLVCCIGLHHSTPRELASLDLLRTPVAAVAASSRLPDAQATCREVFDIGPDTYRSVCEATDAACAETSQLFGVQCPRPLAQDLD
jgi:HD-like signal output (HDOD) protein